MLNKSETVCIFPTEGQKFLRVEMAVTRRTYTTGKLTCTKKSIWRCLTTLSVFLVDKFHRDVTELFDIDQCILDR